MISLDFMKSSEVRKAGDQSNNDNNHWKPLLIYYRKKLLTGHVETSYLVVKALIQLYNTF